MAVPKKKTSPSKRNMRRSHHALKRINVIQHRYGEYQLPHHICQGGFYGKRLIIREKEADQDVEEAEDDTEENDNIDAKFTEIDSDDENEAQDDEKDIVR